MAKRTIQGTFATPVEWRTHPVVSPWTKKVVKATKDGPAVFRPNLPLSIKEYASLYEEEGINTIPAGGDPDGNVFTYWIKMGYTVGASEGKETKYVLIKRDSGIVHARPVTARELKQVWKVKKP